jgi:putative transposase
MALLEQAIAEGLTARAACAVLGLSERRWREWRHRASAGDYERHPKPASVRPYNALTTPEQARLEEAGGCAEWADCSCRELSVRILERHGVYISHVAIWVFERARGLAGHRGPRRRMGVRRPAAPDTSFVSGPNQLWAWDITKLRTGIPHRVWFLYAVLDQWSRKVVGWHVSDRETSAEAQWAWDQALLAEGLEHGPMPAALSDRGAQMRSRSTAEFFLDLGVAQLFARPRTPNDNPYVESLFATVKTAPAYPGVFPTVEAAVASLFPEAREKIVLVHNGFDEDLFRPDPLARERVFREHGIDAATDPGVEHVQGEASPRAQVTRRDDAGELLRRASSEAQERIGGAEDERERATEVDPGEVPEDPLDSRAQARRTRLRESEGVRTTPTPRPRRP